MATQSHRSGATTAAPLPPKPPPRGEPVDVPGGLATERSYYQSRGIISLDVKQAAIKLGDRFSLVNETTKATLIDYDHSSAAFTLGDDAAWSLADAYDVTLRLYLLDPAVAASFAPGENQLRLVVADDASGRSANAAVTLTDVPVFAVTTTSFATGEQRAGGLQGGFEPFAKSLVTSSGNGFLATGILGIANE